MDWFERVKDKISFSLGCWLWTGAKTGNGYGATRLNKKQVGAHVAAYIAKNGEIQKGMQVMHACDNPLCVNPEHLKLGTAQDNMIDKTQKGRAASGEKNGRAKLTEEQVREIRQIVKNGVSRKQAARIFGVSDSLVCLIVKGKNWADKPKSNNEDRFMEQIQERGLQGWVTEYRFCQTRRWRFDAANPDLRLAVEIEGGAFVPGGGRHTRGAGFRADLEKYNAATIAGWRVLRFLPEQVTSGEAIRVIHQEVSKF